MSAIYEYLKQHQSEMLHQLETLVRLESPTGDKERVDLCGQRIAQLFRDEWHVEPRLRIQSEKGNHLVTTAGSGAKKVLLLGHFDTVWAPGVLTYRVDGDRVYGPGIFDMKAGIIQGIWAIKAMEACHGPLPVQVTFLLTTDEEIGSPTSRSIIEEQASENDAVFVLEPSVGRTGAVKTARKGTAMYQIAAHGIAAHAGNHPEDGASAIHELCRQVTRIVDLPNGVPGTTLNVGTIQGGTRNNVVADQASIGVDVRFTDPAEAERLNNAMYALTPVDQRVRLSVSGGVNRPPMNPTDASRHQFSLASEIASEELGLTLSQASVGGGSDGNFTAALGIPTLDGMGAVGDGPHAEHEHILVDGLSQRAALLAHLLLKL